MTDRPDLPRLRALEQLWRQKCAAQRGALRADEHNPQFAMVVRDTMRALAFAFEDCADDLAAVIRDMNGR